MKLIITSLVVVLVLNTQGLAYPEEPGQDAQSSLASTQQAEKTRMEIQKRGVGEKPRVRITLHDQSEVKGHISQIDATSFQVTDKKTGSVSTITYDTVDRVRGGGLSRGSKIAIGIGVAVGVLVAIVLGSLAASGE
jgi:hypothetical protein